MIAIAPQALADVDAGPKEDFRRFIRREPLGVVFTVAAWNYPYLIAVNSVVPALMAGNAVLLKHSRADAAVRRALRRVPGAGGPAGRRVPGAACLARRHRSRHPRSARRLRGVHRLGGRRPRRAARGRRALHRRRPGARRLRPGLCARTTPTSLTRSRTSSTARSSIPASPAAASQRIYVHERRLRAFVEGVRRADAAVSCSAIRSTRHHARAGGAHAPRRTRSARRSTPRSTAGAQAADRRARLRGEPRRARRIWRRRCWSTCDHRMRGHARGDLRPGGRHHEGELGRRGRGR